MPSPDEDMIRARKRAGAPNGFRRDKLLDPGEKCIEAGAEDEKSLEKLARLSPEELENIPEHGGKYQIVPCLGVITDLELLRRPWVIPFLEGIIKLGTKGGACRVSGASAATVDNWMERSPQFARLVKAAEAVHLDRVEESLSEMGIEGLDEPVFQQGAQVGVIRKRSVPAAIAMLKFKRYKDERMITEGQSPQVQQHLHVHTNAPGQPNRQGGHLEVMAERILDGRRKTIEILGPEIDDEILRHDDAK